MCGIAGLLSPARQDARTVVERMVDSLAHRGPDDRGVHADGAIALGHARLSILDLSPAGHQPMFSADRRFAIVFNGEVYNHVELRRELESLGHTFMSRTDTEVVLCAYREWGAGCTGRFNGMWGLAIWDSQERVLFCSRDRMGVKPFYYLSDRETFAFASEIKALAAVRPLSPDHAHVARFLRTSLVDDTEATCFEGVRQLPAGHSLEVRLAPEGVLTAPAARYWGYDPETAAASYDFTRPAATLASLLDDAVRLRMRADVPVGTCLSGGLDSSSIVALASRSSDGPVRTFSSIYRLPGYDESAFIEIVNSAFATDAHAVTATPGRLNEIMPRIAWHQDQPCTAPGVYSQWHVMETAAGHVKVLLDGQGADELLAGYTPYYYQYARSLLRAAAARPSPRSLAALAQGCYWALRKMGPLRTVGALAARDRQRRRPEVRREYLESHLPDDAEVPRQEAVTHDPLADRLIRDTFTVSLPALLRYEDRNSMAFSIEARTPFLDYRIVEFALTLPFHERIRGQWTKYALREAMAPVLPERITWRRDKLGYPTPLAEWLRSSFAADAESVIFSDEFAARGVFDAEVVRDMWAEHLTGRVDHSRSIWRWLSLEHWFRAFW